MDGQRSQPINVPDKASILDVKNRYQSTIKINVTRYPLYMGDRSCFENIFAQSVSCQYRRLENLKSHDTVDFIKNLNRFSSSYLNNTSIRPILSKKIKEYLNFEKYTLFEKHGDYYYFFTSSLQKHSVMMRRKNLHGKSEVFFDLFKHYKKGSTIFNGYTFSSDGKKMAYMVTPVGSKYSMIRFVDVKGNHLNDKINKVKFSDMSFAFGGKGFFYSTYDSIKNGHGKNPKFERHSLYYHKMGQSENDDIKVVVFPEKQNVIVMGKVSNDEKYLYVKYTDPTKKNFPKVLYCDLSKYSSSNIKTEFKMKPLIDGISGNLNIIEFLKNEVIAILSTTSNPTGDIIKIKISSDKKNKNSWKNFVKYKKKRPIVSVTSAGKNYLVVYSMLNMEKFIEVYDKKTGKYILSIKTDFGKIFGISGSHKSNYLFIGISNQISPIVIYYADMSQIKKNCKKVKLKLIVDTAIKGLSRKNFIMKQIYYISSDSKKIPMYLFYRTDLKLKAPNPVLLDGYGGFGFTPFPQYDGPILAFVNNFRGIYALASIRGGGEFGKSWYESGKVLNKYNSFNDFTSAAMYLIENGYTKPSKLSIRGSTNGGLVAAVVSQRRPDLFSTVIIQHGILDMLRYHKIGNGAKWINEYGNPKNKTEFFNLFNYSPLHNFKMPRYPYQIPSMLFLTDITNSQVSPVHTLKYTAEVYNKIQIAIGHQTNPILVKVKMPKKSSSNSFVEEALESVVDIFSFIKETLNIKWHN